VTAKQTETLYDGTRLYPGAGTMKYPFDSWAVDRIDVLRGPARSAKLISTMSF
jgi:hypothetical protein